MVNFILWAFVLDEGRGENRKGKSRVATGSIRTQKFRKEAKITPISATVRMRRVATLAADTE